ncbi:MAG: hypothetical protein AAF694_01395 [Bacteroidota bacterium]
MQISSLTRLMCGLTLITIPSIQFGGYFLLSVLGGRVPEMELTSFQQAMFRAGHAHAGVLILFSLVTQVLIDATYLKGIPHWLVRAGIPFSALLISSGFFLSAIQTGATEPDEWVILIYIGAILLALGLITLGIGLIQAWRNPPENV